MVRASRRRAGKSAGSPDREPRARRQSDLVLWYDLNLKRWMPLLGTVFGGLTVYLLMQVESLKGPVSFVGGLAYLAGFLIWGLGRPADAPSRPGRSPVWFPLVGLVLLGGVALGFVYFKSLYRGAPAFVTNLPREGATARFDLSQPKQTLTVVVHGTFAPDVGSSAEGEYEVVLSRGEREATVAGKLERSTSRTRIRRGVRGASTTEYDYGSHEVASLGAGRYELQHLGVSDTLRHNLRVSVFTSYASRLLVVGGGVALFCLALLLDAIGARAGHRTRAAGAMATAAAFTETFRSMVTPDAISSAVIVGILISFVAGSVLGWVGERVAKTAGGESTRRRDRDDDEGDSDRERDVG